MKKIITVALILTMVLTMAACGGNNTDGEGEGENPITVVSREDGSGTRGAFTEHFRSNDYSCRKQKRHRIHFSCFP